MRNRLLVPASDRALRSLGLAARAGALVMGTGRVREAIRTRRVRLVIIAADAAPAQRDKLLPGLYLAGIPHIVGFDRAALGSALGRGPLSAVGVTQSRFADAVTRILEAGPAEGSDEIEGAGRKS